MAKDYESAPVSDGLGLNEIVKGLAQDLDALRSGRMSIAQAMASAALAKQVFNGARIYLNAARLLSESAKDVTPALGKHEGNTIDGEVGEREGGRGRESGQEGDRRGGQPAGEGEGPDDGGGEGEQHLSPIVPGEPEAQGEGQDGPRLQGYQGEVGERGKGHPGRRINTFGYVREEGAEAAHYHNPVPDEPRPERLDVSGKVKG